MTNELERKCIQYVHISARTGHSVTSVADQVKGPVDRGSAQNSGSRPQTGPIGAVAGGSGINGETLFS